MGLGTIVATHPFFKNPSFSYCRFCGYLVFYNGGVLFNGTPPPSNYLWNIVAPFVDYLVYCICKLRKGEIWKRQISETELINFL